MINTKKLTGVYRTTKYGTWTEFTINAPIQEEQKKNMLLFCQNNIRTEDGKQVREVKDLRTIKVED